MTFRTMGLISCALVVACELEDTKDTTIPDTEVTDEDGDGFAAEDDCDDADAAVNPDAAEVCDGIDNNCDDAVDEGVTITVYADSDGDGYGSDGSGTDACAAGSGQSEVDGDCDDTNSDVRPDASEVCDTVDNDCDTLIDDADDSLDLKTAQVWYTDGDGDTFGDLKSAVLACEVQKGTVADSTDCDDSAADTYPGAAEVCGDNVVNDCDGTVEDAADACESELDYDTDVLVKSSAAIGFGYDGTLGGDYNGDGIDDLIVGAYNTGKTYDGEACIYYGSASGAGSFDEADADVTLTGEAESYFGLYNEYLGDLDADGYDDILIGAYNLTDEKADVLGGIYVVYGGTTSGSVLSDHRALYYGDSTDSLTQFLNHSVADFDGDGTADISFGSSSTNSQFIFSGVTTGTVSVQDADATITDGSNSFLESAAGDLDGDGTPELVICDVSSVNIGEASLHSFSGADLSGDLTFSDATASISGAKGRSGYVCYGLAILDDTNGDGYADLAFSDIYATSTAGTQSEAYLFHGPLSGSAAITDADAAVSMDYSGFLGYSVGGGDYDADGLSDLVLAEPLYVDSAGTTTGAAYLVYGEELVGSVSVSDAVFLGGDPSSYNYGTGVGAPGDLNNDGVDDILITSFVGDTSNRGDAHVIFGAPRY